MQKRPLRTPSGRKLTARRDTLDFRDRLYAPTLCDVAPEVPLEQYLERGVPVLDQENEGACTGFALASVANYLLRSRTVGPDRRAVSPWMFYALARRYDEWPGEDYEGSSIRGALKGWHKHGACADRFWGRKGALPGATGTKRDPFVDGLLRPLGAYYRVDHRDLVAMHTAITDAGILYASGDVHGGWDDVAPDGKIVQQKAILGAHAFAIVAYDRKGFWIQNSWGDDWGRQGFGHLSYDDWLANGTDVWVARLGVPVQLAPATTASAVATKGAGTTRAAAVRDLRPHIVSIGNDGVLRPGGEYGTRPSDLDDTFAHIDDTIARWSRKRILLYAHGGLVDEQSAVERVATLRTTLLDQEVYPLAFIWKTDYFTTIGNILADAVKRRRTEGVIDATKNFMLDRLDDALEPLARVGTGKAAWSEMKENALRASSEQQGGARLVVDRLGALLARHPDLEIHVAAHSAGSIFMAPVVRRITANKGAGGLKARVASLSLWAPACTMRLFDEEYLPALTAGSVGRFALYTLTEKAEQDDSCAGIYHKSLLYLVSNAFEDRARIPLFRDGVALLGMEKFVRGHAPLQSLFATSQAQWVRAPNTDDEGSPGASRALQHGAFDDDRATLLGTLARITSVAIPAGASPVKAPGAPRGRRARSR